MLITNAVQCYVKASYCHTTEQNGGEENQEMVPRIAKRWQDFLQERVLYSLANGAKEPAVVFLLIVERSGGTTAAQVTQAQCLSESIGQKPRKSAWQASLEGPESSSGRGHWLGCKLEVERFWDQCRFLYNLYREVIYSV